MKNKSAAERTKIALKAVRSRKRNEKIRQQKNSERAKRAWETRKAILHGTSSYKSGTKSTIRNFIIKLLLSAVSPKEGYIPTLPDTFGFEKMIVKIKSLSKLKFYGFEIDRGAVQGKKETITKYRNQRIILKKKPSIGSRTLHQMLDINEFLRFETRPDSFAHVFADYCGVLHTNRKAIIHVLENNLVKVGGLIWITLSTQDLHHGGNTVSKLKYLIKTHGGDRYKYEKLNDEEIIQYQGSDNGRGAPMVAVLLRRVK